MGRNTLIEWPEPQGLSGLPTGPLISHLFVEGYITDSEFRKYVNDNSYKPHIEKITHQSLSDDIKEKVRRMIMAENQEELVSLDLDFFE